MTDIFGARASVHIRHSGDLRSLATRLSLGLIVPEFEIGPRETPPYDLSGSLEVMGCELWLEQTDKIPAFQYKLNLETSNSLTESFKNKMYDISPWLARYISLTCDLEVLVSGSEVLFSHGKQVELK